MLTPQETIDALPGLTATELTLLRDFCNGRLATMIGPDSLTATERAALSRAGRGGMIEAVKMVRARLGISLTDAKDIVDRARGK